MHCGTRVMKFALAFLTTALCLSLPLAGAHRPLGESPPAPQVTQGNRANLTEILPPDGPFQTFLRYLQQANLVEVFENQAYRTLHGITIFVPADRAFAAVEPSRHQLKNLMMYHALAKHYALKSFEGLSQINPVTTLAGGLYTVNVTYEAGVIHVRSRWANAKILGTVYAAAPMAVYEIEGVLLPEAIFRAQPHVAAIPPAPALAPSEPGAASASDGDALPDRKAGGAACRAGDRSASYVVAAALGAMTLVAM